MGNIGRLGSAGIRRYNRKGGEMFTQKDTDPGGFSFQSNPYDSGMRQA
jgi:hypothetical protein